MYLRGGAIMKNFMDGIIEALKRQNREKSQIKALYKIYDSSSIYLDDYYIQEECNSR